MTGGREGIRMRRSKQREVILEELRKLKTHPRSDELYTLVRQRLPHVSLGTVYRNLDRLQGEGAAVEIYCGDFVRYDGNVSPHDHFMCRVCRRVWDFDARHGQTEHHPEQQCHSERSEESRPSNAEEGQDQAGFQVENQYTMFLGLCPDCAAG